MNLKAGLWQQQTIKLTMTQELTQAIQLLQYSTQELTSFLEDKAIENPLLQIEAGNVQAIDPRKDRSKKTNKKVDKDKQSWIEQIGTESKSLEEYILSQINTKQLNPSKRKIIHELLYHIDENGYFCGSIEEVTSKLKISKEDVEVCLKIIQEVEPIGIGARSLKECLYLQLRKMEKRNELAELIVGEHFELFAERKWKELSKLLNVKLTEIQEVFDLVQTLNPRPASNFQDEKAVYIVPDVVVKWEGESFSISVFDEALPKIGFNQSYFDRFSSYGDKQVSRFLQEKQQDYQWIMKSLEQRKETLMKVTLKIVEKQPDFFIKGPSHLRPMTMKDLSEEIGIHESTVSRAVREKYVQTSFGTFELKSFFTSTIQTTSDENASSQQVKNSISQLVANENKQKPLSDQEIVHLLKENEGIVVSRRTIAKYRDQLGIPSSSKRKRYV